MKPVPVGVVGLGVIAQTQHLPNLALLDDLFRIEAIADLSPRLLAAIADRLPGRVFTSTDWREVCNHPDVEAVLLLTPGAHQQMSEEALAAGKHVFSEKPLSLTVAGAKHLSTLADRNDRVLTVGYMKLHEKVIDDLMDAWRDTGSHRLIRHTVYHPSHGSQYSHAGLLRFDDADPGVLERDEAYQTARAAEAIGDLPRSWIDLYRKFLVGSAIHTVSMFRTLMGMLPGIAATDMWPPSPPGPEGGPASLFVRGSLDDQCRVEMSWLWLPDYPGYRETLEIHGTAGSAEVSFPPPYVRHRTARLTVRHRRETVHHAGGSENAFVTQLRAFHDCIATGNRPPDAWRSAADLAWLQAALADMARSRAVAVGGEAVNYSQPGRFPRLHSADRTAI